MVFILPYVLLVSFIAYKALPFNQTNYYGAINDKLRRMDSIKESKIVFIGGSATSFGINSKLVQDSLHLPAVNLGTQAGLGYKFILSFPKEHLKKGDIVVCILEYCFYENGQNEGNGDKSLYEMLSANPWAFKYFNINQWLNGIFYSPEITWSNYLKLKTGTYSGVPPYKRNSLSVEGDVIATKNIKSSKMIPSPSPMEEEGIISPEFLDVVNSFVHSMNKKGVEVYIGFPPVAKTYANFKSLNLYNKAKFKTTVLGSATETIYNDTLFFDTDYHLNFLSKDVYTNYLVSKLKPFIK